MIDVKGLRTGRHYAPNEIDDPVLYDQMLKEPLIDENGTPAVPVRRSGAPHFRRLGIKQKIVDLTKKKDSNRHNKTIDELVDLLNDPNRTFEFITHVYSEDDPVVERDQVLYCSRDGIKVCWFSENKIRFDDFTRIQPDISARDITRMSPTGASPAIIIEVIDSHYPEPPTFEKLMALSRAAHHVFFYILGIGPLNKSQKFNSYTTGKHVSVRFTFALLNGELVKNSVVQDLGIVHPSAKQKAGLAGASDRTLAAANANDKQALEAAYHAERSKRALDRLIKASKVTKKS